MPRGVFAQRLPHGGLGCGAEFCHIPVVNKRETVIIFTRFPEAGKAKTRLIPHLGEEGAAQLQREMTEYVVKQACRACAYVEIRYTGGSPEQMRDWLGADLHYVEQGNGNLGERMERAFGEHFKGGATRVVIVGSDCPANGWENIQAAFRALDDVDCVIGPAHDGGYYLIGLNESAPHLFDGMDWGGEKMLEQTLSAAEGLAVKTLGVLGDVDLPEDIPPRISVIIPTLNEEDHLLQAIGKARAEFNVEVIVADGGSQDRTLEASVGAHVIECRQGRAAQQNAGAKAATGDILLFLHADTTLPDRWDWIVREALADPSVALGAFSFKIREQMRGLKFIEATANKRSRKGNMPYGDQGLFLRRATFEKVGGFPDFPIMEDYALVRALRSLGNVVTVPEAAITSGRRWQQHGVLKVTLINKLMIMGYHLGISPEKLARMYRAKG